MNAIELKNVSYQTKDFQLKDISFEVPKGFVTGFIGGNGAGKTPVIRLIMDLIQSKNGQIIFNESRDTLFEKYKIISGSNEDLDVELEELLIYKEVRKTGYIGLTEHYQTFKELFGNRVEIKNPSIEELMIYLEKNKNQLDFKYHQRNEKLI